jgi:hypothetical protein
VRLRLWLRRRSGSAGSRAARVRSLCRTPLPGVPLVGRTRGRPGSGAPTQLRIGRARGPRTGLVVLVPLRGWLGLTQRPRGCRRCRARGAALRQPPQHPCAAAAGARLRRPVGYRRGRRLVVAVDVLAAAGPRRLLRVCRLPSISKTRQQQIFLYNFLSRLTRRYNKARSVHFYFFKKILYLHDSMLDFLLDIILLLTLYVRGGQHVRIQPGVSALKTVIQSWLLIGHLLGLGGALLSAVQRLGRRVCADNVFHVVRVRVQERESAGAQPDPLPIFGSESIHY